MIEAIREQLVNLYENDGSILMGRMRKLIDKIDAVIEERKQAHVPQLVRETLLRYDEQIMVEKNKFSALEKTSNTALKRTYIAQEILCLLSQKIAYINYISSSYFAALSPQSKKDQMENLFLMCNADKEDASRWQTIVSNNTRELDLINSKMRIKIGETGDT